MKKYFNLFDLSQKVDYKTEILSGITVAMALIPEAVAFAIIAGLSPLTGLYAAFVMGLVTAILGGRPGMISGATGAVAGQQDGSNAIEQRSAAAISGKLGCSNCDQTLALALPRIATTLKMTHNRTLTNNFERPL